LAQNLGITGFFDGADQSMGGVVNEKRGVGPQKTSAYPHQQPRAILLVDGVATMGLARQQTDYLGGTFSRDFRLQGSAAVRGER
jgi:hypothetical protein